MVDVKLKTILTVTQRTEMNFIMNIKMIDEKNSFHQKLIHPFLIRLCVLLLIIIEHKMTCQMTTEYSNLRRQNNNTCILFTELDQTLKIMEEN